jgi:HlyD family secretion protein
MSGPTVRLTIGLALIGAAAAGCDRPIAATTGQGGTKAAAPVPVEIVRPTRATIRRTVDEPGQVEAFEVTSIHANIAGYVKSWHVNIGSKITKGQVLAELDVPELVAEVDQKRALIEQAEARRDQAEAAINVAVADVASAQAKVGEARAGIKRADSELSRWKSEFHRVEQLFRDRAQTGSLLDETRNKLRASEAALEEIDAQVKTAEAGLVQSRAQLDKARSDLAAAKAGIGVAKSDARRVEALLAYTKILAPYDGVVTQRNVDTGHLTVSGATGEPLFVVARSDIVTVVVGVPELFAAMIAPDKRAHIRLQAIADRTWDEKVSRTAYALDPKSRTLRTEFDIPNTDGNLHPGLYAYASIILEEHVNVLTLPVTAILRDGKKAACAIVRDGRVARMPLQVGLSEGPRVEVLSGLKGDEAVVKANPAALTEGQAVESIEPAEPPKSPGKP